MRKLLSLAMLIALVLGAGESFSATPSIEVEALLPDTAVLKIDGQRKTLKVGQSFGGVTLIAAYSRTATLEVDGQQMVVGISRRIGSNYQQPKEQVVTIQRDAMLQYHTTASINGRQVQVMVDTGANVVAMSSAQAQALGIDYKAGIPSKVETASGVIPAHIVTLRSVSVGGILVNNVRASVVEGDFPATILLGMTYLQHVKMKEHNGLLSLSRAW
jgi:aspartyl protease family protein